MDIRCPKCGEPWDMDSLHDEIAARWPDEPWKVDGRTDQAKYRGYYTEVRQEFSAKGCEALAAAFGASHNEATMGSKAAAASSVLFDLLGDDVDGVASMLDDLDAMGQLDD